METLKEVQNIPDVFRVKTPSIGRIKKNFGEDFMLAYLELWIFSINEMLNLKQKMTAEQIHVAARMISNEFPLLTVADLKLVYEIIISGRVDKIWRIDPPTVCSWFRKYWDDRMDEAEQFSFEEHKRNKDSFGGRASGKRKKEITAMKQAFGRFKSEGKKPESPGDESR